MSKSKSKQKSKNKMTDCHKNEATNGMTQCTNDAQDCGYGTSKATSTYSNRSTSKNRSNPTDCH